MSERSWDHRKARLPATSPSIIRRLLQRMEQRMEQWLEGGSKGGVTDGEGRASKIGLDARRREGSKLEYLHVM
jgi:hypothetical protein